GYLSGAWALRDDMDKLRGFSLPILSIASLIGGTLGALLLLWTPAPVFDIVIPWLLLAATMLFALAPGFITAQSTSPASKRLVIVVVLAVAIYGGYFNGGLGILLLAAFGALGVGNINAANGLKNQVSALLTAIAILVYIAGGLIYWPEAVWMLVGATSGGYAGARASRRVPVKYLRWCIVAAGAVRLYIINGGHRHSLDLFLRRNTFNGSNADVPNRFYPRGSWAGGPGRTTSEGYSCMGGTA